MRLRTRSSKHALTKHAYNLLKISTITKNVFYHSPPVSVFFWVGEGRGGEGGWTPIFGSRDFAAFLQEGIKAALLELMPAIAMDQLSVRAGEHGRCGASGKGGRCRCCFLLVHLKGALYLGYNPLTMDISLLSGLYRRTSHLPSTLLLSSLL